MPRMRDTELLAICEAEIDAASGWSSGELSNERATAMEYYLGEPYGDEKEGRSQIVTREVLDTVEWILPSLMRIFADRENLVEFDPTGPEDEDQAQQETDRVGYAYWKENKGFLNTYTFVKDALLSKTGVLKTWWDDTPWEDREEYRGLDEFNFAELMNDETVEREVLEYEQEENGFRAVFKAKAKEGRVRIESTPPEEFGVNRDARSPYAKDCTFVYHRTKKTRSDLLEMGYKKDVIAKLPSADSVDTEEQLARRHLDDEQEALRSAVHSSMQPIWITECYLRVDRDGDGIAELVKVTMASGGDKSGSGSTFLEAEDVDRIPFSTCSPVILTHKFYGLSIADLVMDLQLIKSTLTRGILDNMYLANNGRTAINEMVNADDVLTNRPGGVVRVTGKEPPMNSIGQLQQPSVPQETFQLLEYLDSERKGRTGVGDETAALDPNTLANANTGVVALAYDAARAKIELIAEIFAEIGFRTVFEDIHEILSKHSSMKRAFRLRGKWVQVNPGEWRRRENVTIKVGLGTASKERRILGHQQILSMQSQAIAAGFPVLLPEQVYHNVADLTKELGHDPSRYWTDPREVPPAPPQPDPQMLALQMSAQIEQGKVKVASEKNMIEAAKVKSQQQLAVLEIQARERESAGRQKIDSMKASIDVMKAGATADGKVVQLRFDAETKAREQALKGLELRQKEQIEDDRREMEQYKADLASLTELQKVYMEHATEGQEAVGQTGLSAQDGHIVALIQELSERLYAAVEAPKDIERDSNGLMISIGGRVVLRDDAGRAVRIG